MDSEYQMAKGSYQKGTKAGVKAKTVRKVPRGVNRELTDVGTIVEHTQVGTKELRKNLNVPKGYTLREIGYRSQEYDRNVGSYYFTENRKKLRSLKNLDTL